MSPSGKTTLTEDQDTGSPVYNIRDEENRPAWAHTMLTLRLGFIWHLVP